MAGHETTIDRGAHPAVLAYLTVSILVLLLMMGFGTLMRMEQAEFIAMGPMWFYELMTLHGAGMVGVAGIAGIAILWHFLGQYVRLSAPVFVANLALFLVGVAMILVAVLGGHFHGGWTFLHPLPSKSMGTWSPAAAALFLGGMLVIGTGFLLLHLDIARAILAREGGFGRALGWPQLLGRDETPPPPPTIVASTMATIVNLIGIVAGAAILVMMLVNLYFPGFGVDALLAKNLIYFFGHVFINATIYMAVIAVHLLMDFAMPKWMLVMGHVIGYLNTFPILVVTAYGGLMLVYRSGIRWDMASGLLFVSLFGWAAGAMPAFIDGTIRVNYLMHNTLWVPGHFHTYLLLGMMTMVFGFLYYIGKNAREAREGVLDRAAFAVFIVATLGFTLTFLYSGKAGVARRYAAHLPEWVPYDRVAAVFAVLIVAAVAVFAIRFLLRLPAASIDAPRATLAVGAT